MKTFLSLFATALLVTSAPVLAHDGDIDARGALVALSADSATVGSTTCMVTSATEFENSNDQPISSADFKLGDFVKMRCRRSGDSLVAKRLELERERSNVTPSPSASPSPTSSRHEGDDDHHGARGGDDDSRSQLKARFTAPVGVSTTAYGKVQYKVEKRKKRLQVMVHIPLPSTNPSILDQTAAASAVALVKFSRDGAAFAQCVLMLDDDSDDEDDDTSADAAEFKLDLYSKTNRTFREKKGTCDTDLSIDGIQAGMPLLEVDDVVAISLEGGANFLEATLRLKK